MELNGRGGALFMAGVCIGAAAASFLLLWRTAGKASGPMARTSAQPASDGQEHVSNGSAPLDIEDVVVKEQLSRNIQFFGKAAMKDILGSYVIIIGLGGVGAHAAHLLLRSGIGRLRLIDFDQARAIPARAHALLMMHLAINWLQDPPP
jgi:tRNA threonylcarbamoyladenosine dehydratase